MADRDIPEEMVEKAARAAFDALKTGVFESWSFDELGVHRHHQERWRTAARAVLSAALAGRQVVDAACDAIVPKSPPDDWTPTSCGAEMQWFGCCANGHDQRQTLPFDARDRIERVLHIQGVASGSVEGAAARIMRALTDLAAGSGSGED